MPLHEGLVGPFPPGHDPEEYDRLRRRVFWTMPSGLYVLGMNFQCRRNSSFIDGVGHDARALAGHIARSLCRARVA